MYVQLESHYLYTQLNYLSFSITSISIWTIYIRCSCKIPLSLMFVLKIAIIFWTALLFPKYILRPRLLGRSVYTKCFFVCCLSSSLKSITAWTLMVVNFLSSLLHFFTTRFIICRSCNFPGQSWSWDTSISGFEKETNN